MDTKSQIELLEAQIGSLKHKITLHRIAALDARDALIGCQYAGCLPEKYVTECAESVKALDAAIAENI